MTEFRVYPNYDEILRIEQAARRERAAEMGRVAVLAAGRLQSLARRCLGALSQQSGQQPRMATGGPDDANTLSSILEALYASLPAELRERHSQELLTAARIAPAIDFAMETVGIAVRIVGAAFHGIAQGLRAGAWCLDVAARRLMPLQ